MGLLARLGNVVAAPGDVFDHLRHAPSSVANWLVPVAIFVLLSWAAATVLLSQDWAKQQMHELQMKGLQQQVDQGKMTQEKYNQASAAMEKMAGITLAIQWYGGAAAVALISPFFWAFILWLFGSKFLGGAFTFMKALEAASLPYVIGCLGVIVETLIRLVLGNIFAGLSPVLLLGTFDSTNPLHNILPLLSVFALWELAVRSLGLATLARRSFATGAAVVFGAWVLVYGTMFGIGWAVQKAFAG